MEKQSEHLNELRTYVENYLGKELSEFQKKGLGKSILELELWEKVLIYKYSLDGYLGLNEALQYGKPHPLENFLNQTLDKLPDYEGLVFRGEAMSNLRKAVFRSALESKHSIEIPSFLSTTRSEQIAQMFSKGDTILRIASFTGKNIEALAFHGEGNPMNEREVLFKSKSKFQVLEIAKEKNKTYITLIETV